MKKKYIWLAIIAFVVLLATYRIYFPDPELEKKMEEEIKQQKLEAFRKAQRDSLFSCYVRAEKTLKQALKDPDSYEEIEAKYFFVNEVTPQLYIQVKLKYRAKNSFGGFVVETKCFDFDKTLFITNSFSCE
jgi:hypothetical protein